MIEGLAKLSKDFDNLANIDLVKPMDQAISVVEAEARALCPVDMGELRGSINSFSEQKGGTVTGICQTNKKYAPFVEFGTGPKGQESHEGISPNYSVAYTQSPWWIHEGPGENEVSAETAEKYHWPYIDTPEGRFYKCSGQAAQPFLYPALKDNADTVVEIFQEALSK